MSVNSRPEILLYSRIRKSPFFYGSRRHGVAMYSVYSHTYQPRVNMVKVTPSRSFG